MTIKDLKINENIVDFSFNNRGFVFKYMEDGVEKQYGSTSRTEMSQFAEILAKELLPQVGIVAD